jgi:hypothetical protein
VIGARSSGGSRPRSSPSTKSLDSFDFKAIPKLNKMQVLELARCEWIERRENVIALGPSGTGKTHVALGLGLAACQKGIAVAFITAAALVNEMMEARDERRLLRLQKQLAAVKLLIIDELGFVPLSKTGAELLFELISQRYERGSTLITSNLPFDEWTETFGIRAPDRRSARSADPPRQHPRDERRQLSARPKPRPKGRKKVCSHAYTESVSFTWHRCKESPSSLRRFIWHKEMAHPSHNRVNATCADCNINK